MGRILAGAHKGRRLAAPAGSRTRPTAARVRQTLFDILAPRMADSRLLDLCAGSGAVGLEALSRGAARAVLVERSAEAIASARANAATLGVPARRLQIHRQDAIVALAGLAAAGERFDIVFLDPPYEGSLYEELLGALGRGVGSCLAEGALVVAEHFHKRSLPERMGALRLARCVRVGDHRLSFYSVEEIEEAPGRSQPGPPERAEGEQDE